MYLKLWHHRVFKGQSSFEGAPVLRSFEEKACGAVMIRKEGLANEGGQVWHEVNDIGGGEEIPF